MNRDRIFLSFLFAASLGALFWMSRAPEPARVTRASKRGPADDPQVRHMMGMVRFLEERPTLSRELKLAGQKNAGAGAGAEPEPTEISRTLPDWNEYASLRGFSDFEKEMLASMRGDSPERDQLARWLTLNRLGRVEAQTDGAFADHARAELKRNPANTADRILEALGTLTERYVHERAALAQLASELDDSLPEEKRPALLEAIQNEAMRPALTNAESLVERQAPATALQAYLRMEKDPARRQATIEAVQQAQRNAPELEPLLREPAGAPSPASDATPDGSLESDAR